MITFNLDVLAQPGDHLPTRNPDRDGLNLWNLFHMASEGRLGLVIDHWQDKEYLEHWLKTHAIRAATYEQLDLPKEFDPAEKAKKIQLYMTAWGRQDWYVDNDPTVAVHMLRLGIPTMLAASPYIVRPEWNPTTPIQPRDWDTLVAELADLHAEENEKKWRRGQQ